MPNMLQTHYDPDAAAFAEDGQRANSRAAAVSPVTQPAPMHGPLNQQLMQTNPNKPVQSDEQGLGRSPGQQWPHIPHVEQFNFDSLTNREWQMNGLPPERFGWSAPVYYMQASNQRQDWIMPVPIAQAPTTPYTALTEVPA